MISRIPGESMRSLLQDKRRVKKYLSISRVEEPENEPTKPVPAAKPLATGRLRRVTEEMPREFLERLAFAVKIETLSAAQIKAIFDKWSMEVDTDHKPMRSIRAAMRKAGL